MLAPFPALLPWALLLDGRRSMDRVFFEPPVFLGSLAWALLQEERQATDRVSFAPLAFLGRLAFAGLLVAWRVLATVAFLGPTRLPTRAIPSGKAMPLRLEIRSTAPRIAQTVVC